MGFPSQSNVNDGTTTRWENHLDAADQSFTAFAEAYEVTTAPPGPPGVRAAGDRATFVPQSP